MFKSKLKIEIISEYINILGVQSRILGVSTKNELLTKLEQKCLSLKTKYELIMLRQKMIDLSFFILKKEQSFEKHNILINKQFYDYVVALLSEYEENLTKKMKKLFFSELEISFILNFC